MHDVSRSFPGISKFPSQARPGLADVCRDCHAACGQANSATPLGTGAALEGAPLPEAQRPSAENTSLHQANKSPSGNRPCHAPTAQGWQTVSPSRYSETYTNCPASFPKSKTLAMLA